jgi:hypothetical protein
MSKLANEYQAWERLCREMAARAETELARRGLLNVANYCGAQAEREHGNAFANTVPTRAKNVMLQISAKLLEVLGSPGWIRIGDHSINRYRAGVVGRSLV